MEDWTSIISCALQWLLIFSCEIPGRTGQTGYLVGQGQLMKKFHNRQMQLAIAAKVKIIPCRTFIGIILLCEGDYLIGFGAVSSDYDTVH